MPRAMLTAKMILDQDGAEIMQAVGRMGVHIAEEVGEFSGEDRIMQRLRESPLRQRLFYLLEERALTGMQSRFGAKFIGVFEIVEHEGAGVRLGQHRL